MGLLIGLALAGLAWLALWRICRLGKAALQLAAAALLVGLAGYTLQGRAGLVGSPAAEKPATPLPPALPIDLAAEFYGQFNAATPWVIIANGYMTRGDSAGGVATLTSGLRSQPRSSELWIALGNALVSHNGGRPSAASDLAFDRSLLISPKHPGPQFFYGLMLLQQGQVEAGLASWRRILADAPPIASWREPLAQRIAIVERVQALEPPSGSATTKAPAAR